MKKTIFVICLSFMLSGCATQDAVKTWSDDRIHHHFWGLPTSGEKQVLRQEMVNRHPEWSEKVKKAVLEGKVFIGMTDEQVMASWGKPYNKNRTVGTWGVHEQWIYGGTYIYLENGKVTSWQD